MLLACVYVMCGRYASRLASVYELRGERRCLECLECYVVVALSVVRIQ